MNKNAIQLKNDDIKYLKDRNMSILDFNNRVLMMACDINIPLIERLTFIKIIFSNLDEFISVRLPEAPKTEHDEYLLYIQHIYEDMSKVFIQNLKLGDLFYDYAPIISKNTTNKSFNDDELYYIALLSNNEFAIYKYNYLGKPSMDALVDFQHPENKIEYSFLIRFISDKSFRYIYSGEGISTVLEEIKNIVKIKENVVFTHIQTTCKNELILNKFIEYIHLDFSGVFVLNEELIQIDSIMKYITNMYKESEYYYPSYNSIYTKRNYYTALLERDILVYNPYISYNEVLDFIHQMCLNPNIKSIFITLYRTLGGSSILNSLISAKKLGKDVFVYVEPTARGNEKENVEIIEKLLTNGIIVRCNYFNYKIHSKLFLAVDKTERLYAHIGTGNYNEKTVKVYTDLHILTADYDICKSIYTLFKCIFYKMPVSIIKNEVSKFNDLILAPITLRPTLLGLIENEINKGVNGKIYIKCNSLCDKPIIEALYKAAANNVDIKLIVRTAIGILPTNNLEIRSKVGRFLEHERIYIFGDNVYIASADLLLRNIDKRIEAMCRIKDSLNKEFIEMIFFKKWDSTNAFILKQSPLRWVRNV